MHKKLAGDLTSLAHSILQMKDKDDVFALREKAHEIYEKLSVLAYVEEYINNTPNPSKTKEELLEEIKSIEEKKIDLVSNEVEMIEDEIVPDFEVGQNETAEENDKSPDLFDTVEESEETIEEPEIIETMEDENVEEVIEEDSEQTASLEEELQDTISVDVAADLFEVAPKKSLNDKLQGDIQIGLNDRIAFVKNLFDGSQEDFNRVVSQLNTFKTHKEAKKFINKMVKPDYDWTDKEEFSDRFLAIVERKFA